MNDLITVVAFTYPHELAIVKGRLESEGIECFVKDEMTIQVHNFYSNAIGGVKLQVKNSDVENAIEILKEGGYINESDLQPPTILIKLEELTKNIPYINKVRVELRLMILTVFFLLGAIAITYVATLPTTYERLTDNSWCVDYLTYDGKEYMPLSMGVKVKGLWFCDEGISFRRNGTIIFPGFHTYAVRGNWKLTENVIQVSDTDTLQHIFNGEYRISFDGDLMILTSDNTSIICFEN